MEVFNVNSRKPEHIMAYRCFAVFLENFKPVLRKIIDVKFSNSFDFFVSFKVCWFFRCLLVWASYHLPIAEPWWRAPWSCSSASALRPDTSLPEFTKVSEEKSGSRTCSLPPCFALGKHQIFANGGYDFSLISIPQSMPHRQVEVRN